MSGSIYQSQIALERKITKLEEHTYAAECSKRKMDRSLQERIILAKYKIVVENMTNLGKENRKICFLPLFFCSVQFYFAFDGLNLWMEWQY